MVEQVERLDSNLEGCALGELCILLQREIKVVGSRSMHHVTARISESANGLPFEARRIEPEVILVVKTGGARIQRGD